MQMHRGESPFSPLIVRNFNFFIFLPFQAHKINLGKLHDSLALLSSNKEKEMADNGICPQIPSSGMHAVDRNYLIVLALELVVAVPHTLSSTGGKIRWIRGNCSTKPTKNHVPPKPT